jgi:hypothetical protein
LVNDLAATDTSPAIEGATTTTRDEVSGLFAVDVGAVAAGVIGQERSVVIIECTGPFPDVFMATEHQLRPEVFEQR